MDRDGQKSWMEILKRVIKIVQKIRTEIESVTAVKQRTNMTHLA